MRRALQGGFTLVEVVVALALLATIMVLVYSGLTFSLRSWDAGEANGRRVADRRLGENFLRREMTEMFPMRWKDATAVKFAFEGEDDHMKFVSTRAPGIQLGGLSLVSLEVQEDREKRTRNLVMRRAMPDDEAVDFGPLDKAEAVLLVADVDNAHFSYYGAEGDFNEPQWYDKWTFKAHMPLLVKVSLRTRDGRTLPDILVREMLGTEAGCLESSFQRGCRPRRPGG